MGAVAEQAQGDATKEGGAAVPAATGAGMHTNPNTSKYLLRSQGKTVGWKEGIYSWNIFLLNETETNKDFRN